VEVRSPDVNLSAVRCALEGEAVRVGLSYVRSLGDEEAAAVASERERGGPFVGVRELAQRTGLDRPRLEALVASGACDVFGRRRALLWELGFTPRAQTVPGSGGEESQLALPLDPTAVTPALREHSPWERMLADYRTTSLSVGVHPLTLLRPHLPEGTLSSLELEEARAGSSVAVAGMAVARQRPATANGVVFMLLEDEHGQVNLIVPYSVAGKTTKVQVEYLGQTTNAVTLTVAPAAPGIYSYDSSGKGQAILINQDFTPSTWNRVKARVF
jgi:error-prone DNA polymerase